MEAREEGEKEREKERGRAGRGRHLSHSHSHSHSLSLSLCLTFSVADVGAKVVITNNAVVELTEASYEQPLGGRAVVAKVKEIHLDAPADPLRHGVGDEAICWGRKGEQSEDVEDMLRSAFLVY